MRPPIVSHSTKTTTQGPFVALLSNAAIDLKNLGGHRFVYEAQEVRNNCLPSLWFLKPIFRNRISESSLLLLCSCVVAVLSLSTPEIEVVWLPFQQIAAPCLPTLKTQAHDCTSHGYRYTRFQPKSTIQWHENVVKRWRNRGYPEVR